MKMQYEIIEENRKKRFNQLVELLKSEMVIKSERVKVVETSDGPVISIRTALIAIDLNEGSKEFSNFSIGNYDEDSIIKTMLTICFRICDFSRNDFVDVPLSLKCDIDKLIYEIVEIHKKYGFEEPLTDIMKFVSTKHIYAYDVRYNCNNSGELMPQDIWIYSKEKTYTYYIRNIF